MTDIKKEQLKDKKKNSYEDKQQDLFKNTIYFLNFILGRSCHNVHNTKI